MTLPDPIEPAMCTPQLRLQILHGLPFFDELGHDDIRAVDRHFRERGLQPGETVYHAGERAAHFYVVAAGKIKLLRHTLSGHDVLLDILIPGDFFGSLPGSLPRAGAGAATEEATYPDSARAQTACCVLTAPLERFHDILQDHPSAALRLLQITAARLQDAQETIRRLSAHNAEQRVAATLLKLAAKLGQQRDDDILIQMPLSRQDIADMTGTTVETASRILSSFRKRGLIRSGRQWIALPSRHNRPLPALEALADPGP